MAKLVQKTTNGRKDRLPAIILVLGVALILAAFLCYRLGLLDDIVPPWIAEEFLEPLTPAHESLHEGLAALDSGSTTRP